MESNPKTIAQQNEDALLGNTQQEMAKGVAGVLTNRKNKMNKNLADVANKGLAGTNRPNMAYMAQGGIVGFSGEDGSFVQQPYGTNRGKRLMEIMQMDISPAKKRELLEKEKVMTSGPGMPVGQIAGATVGRPEMTPTISPGTELSGLDALSENLLEQRRIEQAGKDPARFLPPDFLVSPSKKPPPPEKSEERKRLDIIDDINKGVFDSDDLKTSPIVKPTTLPMTSGPMLTDVEMPDLTKFKKPEELPAVNDDDDAPTRKEKDETYDEWLSGVLMVLGAPASGRGLGGGNVAMAAVKHTQMVFDNKAKIRELDIKETTAQAKVDLNKLTSADLTYTKLLQQQNNVQKLIEKAKNEVYAQYETQLMGINNVLQNPDKYDEYEIDAALARKKFIEEAIKNDIHTRTKDLMGQIIAIQEKINEIDFQIGSGPPKKVSA